MPSTVTIATLANATEGGAAGSIQLTRTGDTSQAETAYWSIGGTATPMSDYQLLSGQATFDVGASTVTVSVPVVDDTVSEATETIIFTLMGGMGYTVGTPGAATVNIIDNDSGSSGTIYSDTFNWNGVATVTVTVTQTSPSTSYLWNYHVTNNSFSSGIASFALPEGEYGLASGLGSSLGWAGSVGTLLGNPDLVAWQASGMTPALGIGNSADFWFTTAPLGLAYTNGIVAGFAGASLTNSPAGLLVVPIHAENPPEQGPAPALLVTTEVDKNTPSMGLRQQRETNLPHVAGVCDPGPDRPLRGRLQVNR